MKDRAYPFALPLGTEISGYVIDRVIGAGGFGITYEATNPVTGVTVAIKEFYPQGFASRENSTVILHSDVSSGSYELALKKFEQEAAKLTGRYRHANIVRGLNFLRMNNTAYFVMEFIEGDSFDRWLLDRPAPPSELELRAIFEKVFDAVDYIHAQNGMHRDLTPKNIMIRSDGEPILVDFGASGEGLDTDRQDSQAFAQPNYAPPEQLTADDSRMQGRHTDIFSLGGVLYRALAGRPPVKPLKRSHDVALNGRGADPYIPAAEAAREPLLYSSVFLDGVDVALRLDPRDRPSTIAELRAVLGWLDDDTMVLRRPAAVDATDPSEEATRLYGQETGGAWPAGDPAGSGVWPAAPAEPIVPRMDHRDEDATALAPPVTLAPDEVRETRRGWGRVVVAALLLVVALAAAWYAMGPEIVARLNGQGQVQTADPTAPGGGSQGQGGSTVVQGSTPQRAPDTSRVNWTEFQNFALVGRNQIGRSVRGDPVEACKALCRDDGTCEGYSVTDGDTCTLTGEATDLRPEPGARSGLRPTARAHAALRAAVETERRRRNAFRVLDGVSLVGGGRAVPASSQAQCSFACLSDATCKGWVHMAAANSCRVFPEVDAADAAPAVGFVAGVEDADGRLSEAMRRTVTAKTRTAQAFVGAELSGRVIGRERSQDGNSCRQLCLGNATCIAAVQAEGECTLYGQVDDIRRRPDAEVLVDVRQTALVSRIDGVVRERAPNPEAARGQADFFAGFDVVGTALASDRARGVTNADECQAACTDTAACLAYSYATIDRRCQLYSGVADVVPDVGRVSGIYRGAAPSVVDLARRRMVQSEQTRANYRDLPPNCAPEGTSTPAALGNSPGPEQCAFLCRSGASCQGWVYSRTERSCQLLGSVTGASVTPNVAAGLFDPTGRRVADIGRTCGVPGAPNGPVPPGTIGGGPAAAECDRFAGYLYDADLPKGVVPRSYEAIDPSRAVPACLAVLATSPGTARWRLALGRALERDGREVEARTAYREAADSGSGAAAFLYGIMLDKGQGGPEDDLEAERYFKLARSRGVLPAGPALALLYTYSDRATTTNDGEIIGLLTEAANRGHAPSMYRLGELYERGRLNKRFLPLDPVQANAWYTKSYQAFSRDANDQRDPVAYRFLSLHYDGGRGVPRSVDQAVRYLTQYLAAAFGPDNLVARRRGTVGEIGFDEWSAETRRAFQQFLVQAGGFTDTIDGIIGGRSRDAIDRWLGLRS